MADICAIVHVVPHVCQHIVVVHVCRYRFLAAHHGNCVRAFPLKKELSAFLYQHKNYRDPLCSLLLVRKMFHVLVNNPV
jgi:hypothetical protein